MLSDPIRERSLSALDVAIARLELDAVTCPHEELGRLLGGALRRIRKARARIPPARRESTEASHG
jgi:hypothetical protein